MELTAPIFVLDLIRVCPDVAGTRFDLSQLRLGRDAAGCYAAATNSVILALARWTPDPADAPGVWEFGVAARPLRRLRKAVGRRNMGRPDNALRFTAGPPAAETVGGESAIRVTTPEPGKFPAGGAAYLAAMTAPAPPAGPPPAVHLGPWPLAEAADLAARLGGREPHAVAVRPFLFAPPGGHTSAAMMAGMECGGTIHPLPRNLRLWIAQMPLVPEARIAPDKEPA